MLYLLGLICVVLLICVFAQHGQIKVANSVIADTIEQWQADKALIQELRRQNTKQTYEISQYRWKLADTEIKIRDFERRIPSSVPADKPRSTASAATSVSDSHRSAVDALSPLSPLNPMNAAYIGMDHASGQGDTATHCPEPSTRSSSSDGGSSYGGSSSYDSGSSYSSDSGSSSSSSSSCD